MDRTAAQVRVRELRTTDLEPLVQLWTDPDVARNMGDFGPRSRPAVEAWLNSTLEANRRAVVDGRSCAIVDAGTHMFLGWIGFGKPWERPVPAEMDFGYAVLPEHRRRGVATAALKIVLEHCFGELGLHRVYGECAHSNVASARVMVKVGMHPIQSSAPDQQGFLAERGTYPG